MHNLGIITLALEIWILTKMNGFSSMIVRLSLSNAIIPQILTINSRIKIQSNAKWIRYTLHIFLSQTKIENKSKMISI
jgi:hypothetical protein